MVEEAPRRRSSARSPSPAPPTPSRPTGIRCSRFPPTTGPPGLTCSSSSPPPAGQRYVPITVRSPSCAGKIVLKACVQTWQAYNMWGGFDLYKNAGGAYDSRSLVVSLDRPYDLNGADMFLTYERNAIKLAEHLGLDLAYVTSMDIAADPHLLDGASALVSMGHDEYWTPAERANVTAARDQRRQPRLPRRERDVPPDPAAVQHARGRPPGGLLQELLAAGPDVRREQRARHQRLARRAGPRPRVLADRHDLRGIPGQRGLRRLLAQELGVQGHRGHGRRQLPQPGRRRIRPGRSRLPAGAPHRGALALPAHHRARRQLRRLGLLHPRRRGRRLQLRHDALGRGPLRRRAARHRRRHPRLRPRGHRQRAAGLRRRPGRRQVPGARQPGRD